jgi:hypothetical protein
MSTQENNRAIAVFMDYPTEMNYQISMRKGWDIMDQYKFESDWSQLMPVWKKAAEVLWEIRGDLNGEKYIEANRITRAFMEGCQKVEIETAYGAVLNAIEFLTWYNQQNKPNEHTTT